MCVLIQFAEMSKALLIYYASSLGKHVHMYNIYNAHESHDMMMLMVFIIIFVKLRCWLVSG